MSGVAVMAGAVVDHLQPARREGGAQQVFDFVLDLSDDLLSRGFFCPTLFLYGMRR